MSSVPPPIDERYPELLRDLVEQAPAELAKRTGVDIDTARRMAVEFSEWLRTHWAGQNVYIPKGVSYEAQLRWAKMWEQFKGDNHAELAREFGISVQKVYEILKEMRARDVRLRQHDMFNQPED